MRPPPLLASFDPRRAPKRRGRAIAVSRRSLVIAGAAFLVLGGWSGASVLYLLSRDEVAVRLLERQAVLKRGYEERIAALGQQIGQATGQRATEQTRLEQQLNALLARQAAFENRHGVVQALADRAGLEGTIVITPMGDGTSSLGEGVRAYAPPPQPAQRPDLFELRLRSSDTPLPGRTSDAGTLDTQLDRAERTLAALEARQLESLEDLRRQAEGQAVRLHAAIRGVGLDPNALVSSRGVGTGGPLVPVTGNEGPFETLALRTQQSVSRLGRLRRSAGALPFGEPIRGEIDLSSGFGYRLDPFTRAPALHTGLDFRAEAGAPVRASGAGRVTAAEFSGAYGNMVEIDHGHGVQSRYAHLSAIGVSVGQEIVAGAVLGRVGSTGRSTGPHLHYETRVAGDAVDPQRFLKAGATVHGVLVAER